MKNKFRELEFEEIDIPEWQKLELDRRMEHYSANIDDVLYADDVLNDIDNEL